MKTRHDRNVEMIRTGIKTIMMNMLKDSNWQSRRHVSREMEILRKIKNTATEVKTAFNGLICRLDTAEERISKFEDILKETSKIEKQK